MFILLCKLLISLINAFHKEFLDIIHSIQQIIKRTQSLKIMLHYLTNLFITFFSWLELNTKKFFFEWKEKNNCTRSMIFCFKINVKTFVKLFIFIFNIPLNFIRRKNNWEKKFLMIRVMYNIKTGRWNVFSFH